MLTKVGSAGPAVESVIQYQSNQPAQEKKEASEQARTSRVSLVSERMTTGSEFADQVHTRNANAFNKTPAPAPRPVSDAVVMENSEGEVIESRPGLELSQEAVKITVDDVNRRISQQGASIEFSYHEKTRRYSFKVLDTLTGEVIKEVPPQKSLDMVAKMFEMAGLIIDEKR